MGSKRKLYTGEALPPTCISDPPGVHSSHIAHPDYSNSGILHRCDFEEFSPLGCAFVNITIELPGVAHKRITSSEDERVRNRKDEN